MFIRKHRLTMSIHYDFAPDGFRAAAMDRRMQSELGRSIEHICTASENIIAFDRESCRALSDRLIAGDPARPSTFARYYELVAAIVGDRPVDAETLLGEMSNAQSAPDCIEIVTLGSDQLGAESARYIRMMNAGLEIDIGLEPPSPTIDAAFRTRLTAGLCMLEWELPTLNAEIRNIIRQIVICGSDPTKSMQFDGGSHYRLWGALFLNGNHHASDIAVVEALTHESAHCLLFGFTTHEPLVENDDDTLFASPLRLDPRPMDGIFHATFVSARMHWAMTSLARSDRLSPEQREYALGAAAADRHNFVAGIAVVAEHARLTRLGTRLMAGASRYMSQA